MFGLIRAHTPKRFTFIVANTAFGFLLACGGINGSLANHPYAHAGELVPAIQSGSFEPCFKEPLYVASAKIAIGVFRFFEGHDRRWPTCLVGYLRNNRTLSYIGSNSAAANFDIGAAYVAAEHRPGYIVVQGPAYGASYNGRMFLFEIRRGVARFHDVIVSSSVDFKLDTTLIRDIDGDDHPDVRLIGKLGPSWHEGSFVLFVSIHKKTLVLNRNAKLYLPLYHSQRSSVTPERRPVAEFVYGYLSGETQLSDAVRGLSQSDPNAAAALGRIESWNAELHEDRKSAVVRSVTLRGK